MDMTKFFTTLIGLLRLFGFLEGTSFLLLIFIAMPLKYIWQDPSWVKVIGGAHGGLFLIFVFFTIVVAIKQKWKHTETTWKVLLASLVPFGTFYVDRKILRKFPV
jgi:integral membrane protein